MLKWAVTGQHRQSHLQSTRPIEETSPRTRLRQSSSTRRSVSNAEGSSLINRRDRLRRKSTGHEMTNLRRKVLHRDKENHLTSTPLPMAACTTSPLRRLDSLKDLSNISLTPNKSPASLLQTPKSTKPPDKSMLTSTNSKNNPLQYAATLPTFDVEYSPCGIIPGPILALRGVGIADSYFEKPRYLSDEIPECEEKKLLPTTPLATQLTNFSFKRPRLDPIVLKQRNNEANEEESLSSSRMGDITLDRMIDAILESARKDRRPAKAKQSALYTMSPTYTPADDPASDLNEIWDPSSEKYLQHDKIRKSLQENPVRVFNEREVKTPEYLGKDSKIFPKSSDIIEDADKSCHLRRQKAVRRKRRLSIASTMKHSAQKLFANNSFLRRNFEQLAEMETPKGCSNLSPDSGRNSASDLEESGEDVNFTKRRLSFSPAKSKDS